MNFDYLKKNKDFARPVLLGVSLVLAALTAYRLWDYRTASARAQSIVSQAAEKGSPDPEAARENLAKFTELANTIKKENLFVPPVAKRNPVSTVSGIMGNETLIDEKWYKVGDKISDAEIVAVEPTFVKVKWDGKETTFAPISAIVAETPSVVAKKVDAGEAKEKKEEPEKAAKEKTINMAKVTSVNDPLAWMGVELSPKLHSKLMKLWNMASEEDKRRGMAEWNNASDQKRREMLSELEAIPEEAMGG